MASSKLGAWCDRVIEMGWLTAAILTPLFFNLYSRRMFEADKLLLLRSIAAIMVAAWFIRWVDGRSTPGTACRLSLRRPLVVATLALLGATLVTTGTSLAPSISFFGSYTRLEGMLTTLAFAAIFFMMADGLRTRARLDRLILIVILTSVPVAAYGWLQQFGLDPLGGLGDSGRAGSTLGNPIYAAAYLIMVVLLTLSRIAAVLRRGPVAEAERRLRFLRLALYAAAAVLQLGAILFSNSRGPFLGWLAGLGVFGLVLALITGRKRTAIAVASGGLVGVTFLALVNLAGPPFAQLRSGSGLGRFLDLSASGTGQARIAIWEGSANLILPHAPIEFPDGSTDRLNGIRPLVGYGPETLYLVFGQFFPADLIAVGYPGSTAVGRSHNLAWDSLVTGGVLGWLAGQLLFFAFFQYAYGLLGWMPHLRDRVGFAALWVGLTLAGGVAAALLGEVKYLGMGLATGSMFAVVAYLLLRALKSGSTESALGWEDRLLVAGMAAAVAAHFVELQFSFAVSGSSLLFWTCCAIVAALGTHSLDSVEEQVTAGEGWPSRVTLYATLVAMMWVTLLFEFVINVEDLSEPASVLWRSLTFDSAQGRTTYAILGLMLFSWLFALGMILADLGAESRFRSPRQWGAGAALYAALSLGLAATPALGLAARLAGMDRLASMQVRDAVELAVQEIGLLDYTLACLLVLALLGTAALMAAERRLPGPMWTSRWAPVALAVLIVPLSGWVHSFQLDPIRADMMYAVGQKFERFGEWEYALALYQPAAAMAPQVDVYDRAVGNAFLEQARTFEGGASPEDPERALGRLPLLDKARSAFQHGRDQNPLNPDHTIGLARVYRYWAAQTMPRPTLVNQSNQYYAQAVRLAPRDAALLKEWNAP